MVTLVGAEKLFARGLDYDSAVDFEWASVERKFSGEPIETPDGRGWAFHELAKVPTASRVHADALTLMAVFLAHWDNKPENQRLVCLSGKPARDGRCARPMAMLQDVGGTFGPRKTDLDGLARRADLEGPGIVHRQHAVAAAWRRDVHRHDHFRQRPALSRRPARRG